MYTLFQLANPRWTGHVTRMPDERLPKKVFYEELQVGKRSQGGQKKCYKDTPKVSLKNFNIPPESWEQSAQDREKWRCLIRKGADDYEAKSVCEAERKYNECKVRTKGSKSQSSFSELTCSVCNRQFRANIGLISHQRTHQHTWTASSEFGTYRLCEQRRFRRACASAQSRQNLRCSLIQAVNQEKPSDRKPDPWPS